MKILAIETSCDETSISITDKRKVLSNTIFSQIDIHKKYGGVVPEIASRSHSENISKVLDISLEEANVNLKEIDAIAVTNGPGLIGALLVGISFAKSLSYSLDIPLIGVNHIHGHIFSNFIENNFKPPFICLVVSGGHTHLFNVKDYFDLEILGKTKDDAAGEAFDKVARILGLEYPGGIKIDNLSKLGDENSIIFPKAKMKNKYDFSFSGLKSSVLNYTLKNKNFVKEDIAASFQKNVVDTLTEKIFDVAENLNIKKIAICGGVASNSYLREKIKKKGFEINIPKPIFCTDNAAMIAVCGYYKFKNNNFNKKDNINLNVFSNYNLNF